MADDDDLTTAARRALEQRYELLDRIELEADGPVWLARERDARDPLTKGGRLVVIRVVPADDSTGAHESERRRLATLLPRLEHPNLLPVLDSVVIDGARGAGERAIAIVSPQLVGRTLRAELRTSLRATGAGFSADRAERVLRDLASAMRSVHARGLVLRDLNPDHVLLDAASGRALLGGLALAYAGEPAPPLATERMPMAAVSYLAPEQLLGQPVDRRGDVYALGVIGWEMLAGHTPWSGENLVALIENKTHGAAPDLATVRPDVPARLRHTIAGALERHPETRWASADELLRALLADEHEEESSRDSHVDDMHRSTAGAAEAAPASPHEWGDAAPANETPASLAETSRSTRASVAAPAPPARGSGRVIGLAVALVLAVGAWLALGGRGDSKGSSASASSRDSIRRAVDSALGESDRRSAGGETEASARTPSPRERARRDSLAALAQITRAARTHDDSLKLCDVASSSAQRACLAASLADADAPMTRVYGQLVSELRAQRDTTDSTSDGGEGELRAQQRAWLGSRDTECRRQAGDQGPLWARERTRCLSELGRRRAEELAERVRELHGG